MPKILRIINRFNIGGPTYNVAYLTKHLPSEYETLLVGGMHEESEGASSHILDELGIEPVIIGEMKRSIGLRNDYAAYRKLRYIIHKFKPDIVHTHASKAGALGRLAARNEGVPIIVHTFHGHVFHSYFGKAQTYFYKNVERRIAGITDRIIAISERQKEELSVEHKICPAEKISVIPLGFDLAKFWTDQDSKRDLFRKQYSLYDNHIAIGIIGRLVPVKNHTLFLYTAKKLWDKYPERVRFFVVGDGELREQLLNYCTQIGLPASFSPDGSLVSAVTFTSWITDVDRVLAGLDLVALTSFNEGTPVSLIEAQAASKPIVTTRVGGISNIVKPDETAFLADLKSENEFFSHMERLVESELLRQKLSEGGRRFVESRFHYTRLVKDMEILYSELLETVALKA